MPTDDWQPIRTAPLQETPQILTGARIKKGAIGPLTAGQWWYQTTFWSQAYQRFVGWPKAAGPTHWRPLPPPPPHD